MSINRLPNDILTLVFQQLAPETSSLSCSHAEMLPLIAVCRRWRFLALPAVYRNVELNCYSMWNHKWRLREAEINVELIASAGCVHMAKSLDICMQHTGDPLRLFAKGIMRMLVASYKWRGIDSVIFRVSELFSHENDVPVGGSGDTLHETVAQLVDIFTGIFPGVLRLQLYGNDHLAVNALFERVAGAYAKQLRAYEGLLTPLTASCVFERLERADLKYAPGDRLPRGLISTEWLRRLTLEKFPSDFSWDLFAGDASQDIVFPELVRLDVSSVSEAAMQIAQGSHPAKLRFPKLQYATINTGLHQHTLLERAVLPGQMQKLTIFGPPRLFESFGRLQLPTMQSLHIWTRGTADDANALGPANSLLVAARGCVTKEWSIGELGIRIESWMVTCTDLTSLTVGSALGIDTMFVFVERLQRLETLSVRRLDVHGTKMDLAISSPDTHERLLPLRTSIREMSLGLHTNSRDSVDQLTALAKFLLVRVPSITSLYARPAPQQLVRDFCHQYAAIYPHLVHASSAFHGETSRYSFL